MRHLKIFFAILAMTMTAFGLQAAAKGDLNGDGNVNTGDVSALYGALINGSTDSLYDLNGDGIVNTGDVSFLYNLILNPQEYDNEEELFASCYETLQSKSSIPNYDSDLNYTSFLRQLFNLNDLPADEVKCTWADPGLYELNTATFDHDIPQATGMWMRLCQSINQCNGYLNSSANHDPQHDAEIRFLRDLYLYYFMDLFGNPPFTTSGDMFTSAPQLTRVQAFEFLLNDLQEIEKDLAQPRTNTYGRVDKAAAWLLLARLYLNAEVYSGTPQFDKAKMWAYKVITSPYALHTTSTGNYSAFQKLFMGDNDSNGAQEEIILPIPYSDNDDWSFAYSGTTFLICSTFFGEMLSDYPNGLNSCWEGNRSTGSFVYRFDYPSEEYAPQDYANAAGDNRALFYNKGRGNYIRDLSSSDQGYPYAKYITVKASDPSAGVVMFADTDFPLMRVAEAYLTYAEADAMINNGRCTADGLARLNTLRRRSGATAQSRATLALVFDEWSREFGYECRRRIDLVRAHAFGHEENNLTTNIWAWKGGYDQGAPIDKVKNIYGIPSFAMELNKNLQQNPGYDVHFPNLSLTASESILHPDQMLYLNWSDITSTDFYCYPTVYEIQVSFSSSFDTEDAYYTMDNYSDGKYVVFAKTEISDYSIDGSDFENLLKWYERGHGGSISDDHMIYIRVVGNAAGIGKATSNMVAVSVTGFVEFSESNIWWLIGDCIGDGSWNNTSPAAGSSSLVPMLPNGNTGKLVYAGYFPAGSNFLILPPQSVGNWFGPILRGGTENGGQFYSTDGSGSNIIVNNAGCYKITLNTKTYSVTWEKLSPAMVYNTITIPGYYNNWVVEGNPMTKLCTVHDNHDWVATLDLNSSPYEFKFAANDLWEYNWGAPDFPFGVGKPNGMNIQGNSGRYYIYFNDILGTYGAFSR